MLFITKLRDTKFIKISTIEKQLSPDELAIQVKQADVVIDATDNFSTRFLINKVCFKQQTPLVSGAAIRMEGQVIVFANQGQGPCYQCLYKDEGDDEAATCSENGILAPVVGIIGSIQAMEAMKLIMSIGQCLESRLLLLDAYSMEWRTLKLSIDPDCPICSISPKSPKS